MTQHTKVLKMQHLQAAHQAVGFMQRVHQGEPHLLDRVQEAEEWVQIVQSVARSHGIELSDAKSTQ